MKVDELADRLWPFFVERLGDSGGAAAQTLSLGGSDVPLHALVDHTGELAQAQAPWALTEQDLAIHTANAAAHHPPATAGHGITMSAQQVFVNELANFSWAGTHSFDRLIQARGGVNLYKNPLIFGQNSSTNTDYIGYDDSANIYDFVFDAPLGAQGNATVRAGTFRARRLDTQSGNMEIAPRGDLVLSPEGEDVLPRGHIDVDLGDYNRMFRTLFVAEIYAENLVAQHVRATIGGRIKVAPTNELTRDMSPSSGSGLLYVKNNDPSFRQHAWLELQGLNDIGLPQFEAVRIVAGPYPRDEGDYLFVVSRNHDGTGQNTWREGAAVVSTGDVVGTGHIELTATSTVYNHLGPTMTVYSRTNANAWNGLAPVVSIGNLESFAGYSEPEFGIGIANNLTLEPNNGLKGILSDRQNGPRLFNVVFAQYFSGQRTFEIDVGGMNLAAYSMEEPGGNERSVTFYDHLESGRSRLGRIFGYDVGERGVRIDTGISSYDAWLKVARQGTTSLISARVDLLTLRANDDTEMRLADWDLWADSAVWQVSNNIDFYCDTFRLHSAPIIYGLQSSASGLTPGTLYRSGNQVMIA